LIPPLTFMSSFSNLFSKLLRLDRLKKGKAKDFHSKVKMLLADLTEPEKNTNVEEIKGLSLDFQSRHVVVSAQALAKVSRAPHQGNVQPSRFSDVLHFWKQKRGQYTHAGFQSVVSEFSRKLDCLFVQLRSEGILYIVKEGYFMLFLFNI
ncbi:hypothetical protein DY000_02049568, partial [Brassica cretica]